MKESVKHIVLKKKKTRGDKTEWKKIGNAADTCVCASSPGAKKMGIKGAEQREKWRESVSHVEECSRLEDVTLIGVLAVKAWCGFSSFCLAELRKCLQGYGRCLECLFHCHCGSNAPSVIKKDTMKKQAR